MKTQNYNLATGEKMEGFETSWFFNNMIDEVSLKEIEFELASSFDAELPTSIITNEYSNFDKNKSMFEFCKFLATEYKSENTY